MTKDITSEKVRMQFVGRHNALNAFYMRLAYRHMQNGIYYSGRGGVGKTWVLKKIINDNQDDPIRIVCPIIDFFNTQNHTVRGLQASIKERLESPTSFRMYDEALNHLRKAKTHPETLPSAIVNLEAYANEIFIKCVQDAIVGREVFLLFDTFERVQNLFVGKWFRNEFLPNTGDLIVAISGRSEPASAKMPDNVAIFELQGLDNEAFSELVRRRVPSASNEIVESIWKHTNGSPLIAHLIFELTVGERTEFLDRLTLLDDDETIQDISELQLWLMGQFIFPMSNFNKAVWAMSYLHRRFDEAILRYIVENTKWFEPSNFDLIFNDLSQSQYIKEYPHQQSHLLHDEIQRMVAEYAMPEVAINEEFFTNLHEVVVNHYYLNTISEIENTPEGEKTIAHYELACLLRSEHLGYTLDQDLDGGLDMYESYRGVVETQTQDYDFEELIWAEVRGHLNYWPEERSYQIALQRGQWLRKHSLFQKAEDHYRQMLSQFTIKEIDTLQSLGFMLMRQGEVNEARTVFLKSRSMVEENDYSMIATIENNLGQTARRAGEWDQALEHYANSFLAATIGGIPSGLLSVYVNRGYLYSLKGLYSEAKNQCEQALKLIESLADKENEQSRIFASMNLGTAYRHSGEYSVATKHYTQSLEVATAGKNKEAICNLLQHLGINEFTWGHKLRQDENKILAACNHQKKALQYLIEALDMAQSSDWRSALADGLNRLGKVYREIHRLLSLDSLTTPEKNCIKELLEIALKYQPPFEIEFEKDFLTVKNFVEANWLEKSVRLFEISALLADRGKDYHRTLESWTETARLLEELGMDNKVKLVIRRVERIKGFDYQEKLFEAISQLILADLDFKQNKTDQALVKYSNAYTILAEQSGYAIYLLKDRLKDLEWRLLSLPKDTILEWCNFLEKEWQSHSLLMKRPEMRNTIEYIRIKAMTQ